MKKTFEYCLRKVLALLACLAIVSLTLGSPALGQSESATATVAFDIEKPPFQYSETEDSNRVSRLIAKLDAKEIKLDYSSTNGYLRSILAALEIPESSQTLVFSKTSLQVKYISRRNPRAIYFNDDTYVGWVRGSSLMEISTNDPKLGVAFYTVGMSPWRAKVERAYYDCLGCHATSMTQGVPGHTVRSVFPGVDGSIDSQRKSYITSHSSPFSQRWGGWYVTGKHGDMTHMGNAIVRGGSLDTRHSGNLLSLRGELNTLDYLSPYSDIVALMVLEHQSQTYNTMTRANFSVRQLLDDGGKRTVTEESEAEFNVQLNQFAKEVVQQLLFCGETPLISQVKGSLTFRGPFERRGPRDREGRSLREFDMSTRMFKYPCSYMIYTPAFDSLADELRHCVIQHLSDVLEGRDQSAKYSHLTKNIRHDILAILRETKPAFKQRSVSVGDSR